MKAECHQLKQKHKKCKQIKKVADKVEIASITIL